MALEFLSKVLTEYKADTSDHVSALKKLKGEERERAKATIEANEQVIGAYEDQIKSLGRLAAGIGAAYAAGKIAVETFRAAAEHSRLELAASGVSISRLADATKGLRTNTELLADAARLNHGAIKLTTEQMEIAEQAMLQYTRQGIDNAKAHDAILQAVTALKVDGLKDLGVFVDMAGLSMEKEADRGEILRRVFGELTKASSTFANQSLSDAEKIEASANKLSNAFERMKVAAGNALVAAHDAIRDTSNPRDIAKFATFGIDVGDVGGLDEVERQKYINQTIDALGIAQRREGDITSGRYAAGQLGALLLDPFMGPIAEGPKSDNKTQAIAKRGTDDGKAYSEAYMKSVRDSLSVGGRGGGGDITGGLGSQAYGPVDDLGNKIDIFGKGITLELEKGQRYTDQWIEEINARNNRKTIAETIFGDVPTAAQTAAEAFQAFTGAASEAWGAAITGADSFGHAMKKAFGASILGVSENMFAHGIQEGALALASLALGPLGGPSAAAHAKAAAGFFAGAAITGGLASALGAGGGGGAAAHSGVGGGGSYGAGSAAPRSPTNGNNEKPAAPVNIIVGDPLTPEWSARSRQNEFKRLVENVTARAGGGQY